VILKVAVKSYTLEKVASVSYNMFRHKLESVLSR